MSQSTRTMIFVGAAVLSVAAAAGLHLANRPASLAEYSDEGEEFFPDFKDPNKATSMRVAAFNEETAQVDVFNVEFKNGDWRIPSHHDYPADGQDRLAKTATSVIGIRRGALVSTMKDDHKRLGVLDPLDESITGTEGRGDRITLSAGENSLADFVIGTRVEDQENTYHVRAADEDRTYRAELNIDVSTKFADWIEPDLLDIRRADLREIAIDQYRIDETRGTLVQGDLSDLSRTSDTDPWKLNGINEETEEVKTSTVNQIINALDDLRIVGVRPKPPGLSADLRNSGSIQMDALAFLDLQSRGFFIDSRGALVSNEGEVRVGTSDGVRYTLRFGEVFTGTDVELEIGKSAEASAESESKQDEEQPSDEAGAEKETAEDEKTAEDDSLAKSRYVFITANFDEALIEPPGQEPTKPEPPAGMEEHKSDDASKGGEESSEAESDTSADSTNADAEVPVDTPASTESDSAEEAETGDAVAPDPEAEHKKALEQYERDLEDFQQRQKTYEENLKKGQERAEELNARFADWYYVISADSFDKIRVSRSELVEAKEPEEKPESTQEGDTSAAPQPSATSDAKAGVEPKNAAESPVDDAEMKQDRPDASEETPKSEQSESPAPEKSETPTESSPSAPEGAADDTTPAPSGENADGGPEDSPSPEQH